MRLTDFLDNAFLQYGQNRGRFSSWKHIDDFLYDSHSCIDLLYHYLDVGPAIAHSQNWNLVSLYRSQHILITFLLGLGISEHFNLLKGVNIINSAPDEYLWMLTAIIHDYGYLDWRISQYPHLGEIDNKYQLLDDNNTFPQLGVTKDYSKINPQFLTYPYDIIKKYYAYNAERLNRIFGDRIMNKDNETVDHGIFGACLCYQEYCENYIDYLYPRYCISSDDDKREIERMGYKQYRINMSPSLKLARTEPLLYKTACLIAAQHNMFRSGDSIQDKIYINNGLLPLLSTAPIAVTRKNPLLFLLSIVDTIECSKRFENLYYFKSKSGSSEVLAGPFKIPIKQVLENVNIELDDVSITIDYSGLKEVINNYWALLYRDTKRKTLFELLRSQISSAAGIQNWVECRSEAIDDYVIRIKMLP